MLGNHLWTNQTPEEGVLVRQVPLCVPKYCLLSCYPQVMVAESVDITSEKYLAFLMDRAAGGPAAVASRMVRANSCISLPLINLGLGWYGHRRSCRDQP